MTVSTQTIIFQGIDVVPVDVQAQIAPGLPAFQIVGLPDKAVSEARERVRSALHAIGLSLPTKRVVVNMAPADLLKAGGHFDLAIAMAILGAMEVVPADCLNDNIFMGELSLDGSLRPVAGILPATMHAYDRGRGLVCPRGNAREALWVEEAEVIAPASLLQLINHIKGTQVLSPPDIQASDQVESDNNSLGDMSDIKGQETAKRALEIAAAGGHNMLMIGPPGSGKSMLASRLPTILPPLTPKEALDISVVHSVAGLLRNGKIRKVRPYRAPHHSASLPALVGGGHRASPGEISLAHNGVLFLDELPEFNRNTLEALRQPLENGETLVARVNYHVTYPARFQLIAAMNPCRCGYMGDPGRACGRAPKCGRDYQAKLSGPLLDRIDIFVDVPPVAVEDLSLKSGGEQSATILARVSEARDRQTERASILNAHLPANDLDQSLNIEAQARDLLVQASDKMKLSARSYHRMLRLARTIADLDSADAIRTPHMAEALSYRQPLYGMG